MNDLLAWGQKWHYPYLALGKGECLRHGEAHWRALAQGNNQKKKLLVWQRIQQWNERAATAERSA